MKQWFLLVVKDGLGWAVGAVLTVGAAYAKGRSMWRQHRAAQDRNATAHERVADLLDTTTAGGLADVVAELRKPGGGPRLDGHHH